MASELICLILFDCMIVYFVFKLGLVVTILGRVVLKFRLLTSGLYFLILIFFIILYFLVLFNSLLFLVTRKFSLCMYVLAIQRNSAIMK